MSFGPGVCLLITAQFAVCCDEVLNWTASHWARFTCHKTCSLYWPGHAHAHTRARMHAHTHSRHSVPCHPPTSIPHHSTSDKTISWVLRYVLFSVCVHWSESMLCSCQESVYSNCRAVQGARRWRGCGEGGQNERFNVFAVVAVK